MSTMSLIAPIIMSDNTYMYFFNLLLQMSPFHLTLSNTHWRYLYKSNIMTSTDDDDIFNFSSLSEFAEFFSLSKKTVSMLENNGLSDGRRLVEFKEEDVKKLKLPKSQSKLLRAGVLALTSLEGISCIAIRHAFQISYRSSSCARSLQTLIAPPHDDDDESEDDVVQLSPTQQTRLVAQVSGASQLAFDTGAR